MVMLLFIVITSYENQFQLIYGSLFIEICIWFVSKRFINICVLVSTCWIVKKIYKGKDLLLLLQPGSKLLLNDWKLIGKIWRITTERKRHGNFLFHFSSVYTNGLILPFLAKITENNTIWTDQHWFWKEIAECFFLRFLYRWSPKGFLGVMTAFEEGAVFSSKIRGYSRLYIPR